jgi:dolichol-phosphate mannosyltransferase
VTVPSAESPRILISVATYNERDNLSPLLAEIQKTVPSAELLVIDDNSPDGTGQLADELAVGNPRLHVMHRPGKLGLGTAILAAMRFALENDFDLLINMDADFSHHPRHLPALLQGMDRRDVMIGSRYVRGGGSENWPLHRLLMSRSINALVSLLMRVPARDCSGSYRCYRVAKLRQTRLDHVQSRGYSFQQEVLYRCRKAGCKIGETPIVFENRRAGKSKVNLGEAIRSIAMIFRIGVPAFFGLD